MLGAMALGTVMSRIHLWLPDLFPERATFIYTDAMIAVMSIVASLLLAKLKLENWILWILVNLMSVAMYAMKGVMLVSIQYVIFLFMASYGFVEWKRKVFAKISSPSLKICFMKNAISYHAYFPGHHRIILQGR